MKKLSDLWIQDNRFGGPIPSELGLCLHLRQLFLEENFFRGSPPSSLGTLTQLGKEVGLHEVAVVCALTNG